MASNPDSSVELNKDGSVSRMRNHRGNKPVLPQDKSCPYCSAKFTRITHLTRHVKNHLNERLYRCVSCPAQFTRSDLLARHRKICEDPNRPGRLRSCILCTEAKVKCDRKSPSCSRCVARGKDCVFTDAPRRRNIRSAEAPVSAPASSPPSPPAITPDPSTTNEEGEPNQNQSSITLGSLSQELADLTALTAQYANSDTLPASVPVHSHLSPDWKDDVFQPFFTDIFDPNSAGAIIPSLDEFPLAFPVLQQLPPQTNLLEPWFQELLTSAEAAENLTTSSSEMEQRSLGKDFFTRELQAADPKHYLYLFFNAFLVQMPVVHSATFKFEDKPPYLIKAMKACGALFVKTRKAANYITECLAAAREGLAQAFTKTSMEPIEQMHLVLAVVLLQTIGLFHQKADERTMSQFYHQTLVFMIRRAGLVAKNSSWVPVVSSGEEMWRAWAAYEMTKRALLFSYLHDCCFAIYFALPPSYVPGEVSLRLPCDETLWRAASADEWLTLLASSPHQPSDTALAGHPLETIFSSMMDISLEFVPVPVSPFGHFVLIHAILRDLFAACPEPFSPTRSSGSEPEDGSGRTIVATQYALHNWLHSWTSNCAQPAQSDSDEPAFVENVLPFYWLGQVAILAHQEGFNPAESNNTADFRFKLVKRWLRRIRVFLAESDGESTMFWDKLVKTRLQTWQLEYDTDRGDDQDGLLGFFPATS